MTDVEFEDESSKEKEIPHFFAKENYDLELGLALSKSLNPLDTMIVSPNEIRKLYSLNIDFLLRLSKTDFDL
jgi:hypothetical protein